MKGTRGFRKSGFGLRFVAAVLGVLLVAGVLGVGGFGGVARAGGFGGGEGVARAGSGEGVARAVSGEGGEGVARAVLIIGNDTNDSMSQQDMAQTESYLTSLGISVSKFYSPNDTWNRVKPALQGASIVVYAGHGCGYDPPGGPNAHVPAGDKNGFLLDDSNGNGDFWSATKTTINEQVRLATNALVIMDGACYSAGKTAFDLGEMTGSNVIKKRIDEYSDTFLNLQASYCSVAGSNNSQPRIMLNKLFSGGRTLEQARDEIANEAYYRNDPDCRVTRHRYAHPTVPGMMVKWAELVTPANEYNPRCNWTLGVVAGKMDLTAGDIVKGYVPPAPDGPADPVKPDTTLPRSGAPDYGYPRTNYSEYLLLTNPAKGAAGAGADPGSGGVGADAAGYAGAGGGSGPGYAGAETGSGPGYAGAGTGSGPGSGGNVGAGTTGAGGDALVRIEFTKPSGNCYEEVTVGAGRRVTVDINAYTAYGGEDVSLKVLSDRAILAERAMYFNAGGRTGGHDAFGSKTLGTEWYFAEGATLEQFDTWYLVQNPNAEEADVTLTLMRDDGHVQEFPYRVPGRSRFTVHADELPGFGNCSLSAKVASSVPVAAERAVYFNYKPGELNWTGGHDVQGVAGPATSWSFAEGCTHEDSEARFDTWFLIQNPNAEAARIHIDFQRADGKVVPWDGAVGARSRFTLAADAVGGIGNDSFSAVLTADAPVIAERAMYFNYRGIDGGHDAVGLPSPGSAYEFAEGYTAEAFDTFLLVQNPNGRAVTVDVTYSVDPAYGENRTESFTVGPHARFTRRVDDLLPNAAFGMTVAARGEHDIMAERAVYFNYKPGVLDRTGGHDAVGSDGGSRVWFFAEGYTGW